MDLNFCIQHHGNESLPQPLGWHRGASHPPAQCWRPQTWPLWSQTLWSRTLWSQSCGKRPPWSWRGGGTKLARAGVNRWACCIGWRTCVPGVCEHNTVQNTIGKVCAVEIRGNPKRLWHDNLDHIRVFEWRFACECTRQRSAWQILAVEVAAPAHSHKLFCRFFYRAACRSTGETHLRSSRVSETAFAWPIVLPTKPRSHRFGSGIGSWVNNI